MQKCFKKHKENWKYIKPTEAIQQTLNFDFFFF